MNTRIKGHTQVKKSLLLVLVLTMLATTGGCKQGPWLLWDSYSAHFIDDQGRVVDHQGNDRTTSEGQAYGLFFALVNNDRARFDHLLNWTRANMASGDLSTHLPGWLWGKNAAGEWKSLDSNSASDADVWMAYTLIEAGRMWKAPAYSTLGHQMMTLIAKSEITDLPGFGLMLLPAPIGYHHQSSPSLQSWTLNPSYLPLFLFEPRWPLAARCLEHTESFAAERGPRVCHGLGQLCPRRWLFSGCRASRKEHGNASR